MRGAGLSPWMFHKESVSDTTYPGPIVDAVWACHKFAVMCSKSAFESDDVVRELHLAKRARKPLVAFFLDSYEAPIPMQADFEYFLPGRPWIFVLKTRGDALRREMQRTLLRGQSGSATD